MKGILLVSHGDMAKGMLQSSSLFFGNNIEQCDAIGLQIGENPEDFCELIGEKIKELDSGDGVIILCDLFGGSPSHETTPYLEEGKVDVICGMNFPMFLELLGLRLTGDVIDLESLMNVGREGVKSWAIPKESSDDDFY